jgi:pimeloyl-ACP methyl ester carboxylesterase
MRELGHWIVDYLHLFRGQSRAFLHREQPKHYLKYVIEGKSPVILLPGILEKWGFLKDLGDAISQRGHPVFIVPGLGYHLSDITTSAKVVRELIDENDLQNVVLIGHSKGGLVGKDILVHENFDNRVVGIVAVATPFSGSRIARLVPHKSFKELSPESHLIQDLNFHTDVNHQIISVFPVFDNHVWSEEGSRLEGAKNIQVEAYGHHKVLFTKQLLEQVIQSVESF